MPMILRRNCVRDIVTSLNYDCNFDFHYKINLYMNVLISAKEKRCWDRGIATIVLQLPTQIKLCSVLEYNKNEHLL